VFLKLSQIKFNFKSFYINNYYFWIFALCKKELHKCFQDLFKITPLRVDNNEPPKQHKGQSSLPSPKLNEQNWSTKKSPQLPTISPTKSMEILTTIRPFHFWEWTEKTLIGSKSSSDTTEIVPLKPSWENGKGGGRENLGKESGLPFGIGISNAKEFEGHGVRVVESTEPGPWEK
jgi:hypothetical protein